MWQVSARAVRTLLALWAFWIVPCTAQAQVTPLTTWVGGQFPNTLWQRPTQAADGAYINCAPGTQGCTPLNRSMCDRPGVPIEFVVGPPSSAGTATYLGSNQTLYAFLSTANTCIYSTQTGGINNNPNYLIGTGAPVGSSVFFNGSTPFVFPAGGLTPSAAFPQLNQTGFTTQDLLRVLGACPPANGVQLATYYLCIGVDAGQTGGVNNGTASTASTTTTSTGSSNSGSDPFAFVQFQVDTLPPAVPSGIDAKGLNGRVALTVTYDTSTLDAYSLRVKATSDPANLSLTDADQNPNGTCDDWTGDVTVQDRSVYGDSSGSATFTIDGTNGTTYGFCAQAIDYMGNISTPSPVVFGRPRPECDLFGCYPAALQTGYCGQQLPPAAWGLCAGLALWRAHRRPRRTRNT
jgi:hypothetical protein